MEKMNEERQTLQIVSIGQVPFYDKHYIGIKETQVINDPFKSGTIHPVVKRLGIDKSKDHLDYYLEIKTSSEEFGKEQGYITQSALRKTNLIEKHIYKELQARKEITTDTIKEINSFTKHLEHCVRDARREYIHYLSKLGYIEEETGDYDEDTKYFMVHPLYINEWKKYRYPSRYPDWAVKEIGYFPEN